MQTLDAAFGGMAAVTMRVEQLRPKIISKEWNVALIDDVHGLLTVRAQHLKNRHQQSILKGEAKIVVHLEPAPQHSENKLCFPFLAPYRISLI